MATPPPTSAPAPPTGLTAAATSGTTSTLTWTDTSDNESSFRIERGASNSGPFSEIAAVPTGTTQFTDTALSAGTTFYYRVRARNSVGDSAYSNVASATTPPLVTTPPTAPTGLTAAVVSSSSINLTWTDNATDEIGYKVERATSSGGPFTEIVTLAADAKSFVNSGLTGATTYYFRVLAYNSAGNSGYSNTANATTASNGPTLSAPAGSTGSITLTWTYSWPWLGSNQDGYQLEESTTSPTSGFVRILTTSSQGVADRQSPKSYTITRSTGTYYYRVRALVQGTFLTDWSTVVTVVVTAPAVSTTVVYASADNTLIYDTTDPAAANTVYQTGIISVGCNWIFGYFQSDWLCSYSALKFDIQGLIVGKTVHKAILRLYPQILPADLGTTYAANAFADAWSAGTITFANQPLYYLSGQATVSPPISSAIPLEFDVTTIARNWANGTWANNGLLVRDTNWVFPGYTAFRSTEFDSMDTYTALGRRPQLYLEYE